MGQRFSASFVLKFALQRGEWEKREGVKISNRAHRAFDPRNTLSLVPRRNRRDVISYSVRRYLSKCSGVIKTKTSDIG